MDEIHQMRPVYGEREKEAIESYLDSGRWLTEYEETRTLERELGAVLGSDHVWMTPNGTTSLVVALRALDVGPGDVVVVPDFTMVATAYAVSLVGAEPAFVDVDPVNLCLDPAEVDEDLADRAEALIYVSLNGRSHDMSRILAFAEEHDLTLVEDAAQSLGSTDDGRSLGTFGAVGTFSFSHPKIITSGQGGAVVTDDAALSERISKIRNFGRPESGVDDHVCLGLNAKFTDLQAVFCRAQLTRLEDRVERKKAIYSAYADRLVEVEGVSLLSTDLEETPPWFVDVLVADGDRKGLREALDDAGVGSRPMYPPVHTQGPYAGDDGDFPHAVDVAERGLWLPSSVGLGDDEIEYVCSTVADYFA